MKRAILLAGICWAAAAFAVTPTISNVSISQAADVRSVTISYDLDTDAYVTLELRAGDAPLAPAAYGGLGGNVNRPVAAGTGRQIVWRPDRAAAPVDLATVKPVLTAWHKDVPPTYMVVDLQGGVVTYTPRRTRYHMASRTRCTRPRILCWRRSQRRGARGL